MILSSYRRTGVIRHTMKELDLSYGVVRRVVIEAGLPVQRRGGAFRKSKRTTCSVRGCRRSHLCRDLCSLHYSRLKRGTPLGAPVRTFGSEPTSGYVDGNGYRIVSVGPHGERRKVKEHRYVMEQMIGRTLLPDETVHHRNGVRHDNRPANLELRVASHGKHISRDEAVAWAREMIARYDN